MNLGDVVAFAACILGFPVAYVPDMEAGEEAFLSGVPLDVYECVLVDRTTGGAQEREHVMIKFSCPQAIGNEVPPLGTGVLRERLKTIFEQRLRNTRILRDLDVRHVVETLDRVAM